MGWLHGSNLLNGSSAREVENAYLLVRGADICNFCQRKLKVGSKFISEDLIGDYQVSFGNSRQKSSYATPDLLFPATGFFESEQYPNEDLAPIFERHVKVCDICGWWLAFEETLQRTGDTVTVRSYAGAGTIKILDLKSLAIPIEEVRAYLAGRYEERHEMNPTLFERTVASVFKDLGYHTRATGCSGDGGVDVILQDSAGSEIGVQVKRYRGTIQVDQIRELTGALVLKGLTKGIFVTTSRFTTGAPAVAALSALRGHPIELIDADQFLEQLEIAQRQAGSQPDDAEAPWQRARLRKVHERSGRDGDDFFR
jgi:restriction system protein